MGGVAVTSAKRQHWFGKVTGKKIEGKKYCSRSKQENEPCNAYLWSIKISTPLNYL